MFKTLFSGHLVQRRKMTRRKWRKKESWRSAVQSICVSRRSSRRQQRQRGRHPPSWWQGPPATRSNAPRPADDLPASLMPRTSRLPSTSSSGLTYFSSHKCRGLCPSAVVLFESQNTKWAFSILIIVCRDLSRPPRGS